MKHLVVCLDGTWNNADKSGPLTNIGRLTNMINPKASADAPLQRVYYDAGVGTGNWWDRIKGGAFGFGLGQNVLQAYRFLSQFYENGDRIYVFGFSRGAFTARSLCGFIAAAGLLTAQHCDQANLDFAWKYYRTPPKQRYPADQKKLAPLCNDPSTTRISFLGVFDTVGALGIPRKWLNGIGRSQFQFHDTDVSSCVDNSIQALAIDEKRIEFEAAVWAEPRHRSFKTVEQVWFPGVHANIGGGYEDTGLSDVVLEWMTNRLTKYCPELLLYRQDLRPDMKAEVVESRLGLYYWRSRLTPLIRRINYIPVPDFKTSHPLPHSHPIGEMVHWTAMKRWAETSSSVDPYVPPNLLAALNSIENGDTLIVDEAGESQKWADIRPRLLDAASQ